MTPLSPARREAEAFALALDAARDGARGDVADRYADLLTCVQALRTQETPAPRADFVADLRTRLMDAADTLLVPAEADLAPVVPLHVPATTRRQRRISLAAAAFVVVGGTAGMAAAAENSLPGDVLYPLKRGIESAQVSLNSSEAGKGLDLLDQAGTRLSEIDSLIADERDVEAITETLASFKSSAASGADHLFVEYQDSGDAAQMTGLRAILASQAARLDALSDDAPKSAQDAFDGARQLLIDLDQQAQVLCGGCGSGSIADRFAVASSAPSLAALLQGAADQAQQAADQAGGDADLADKADDIAQDTPTAPAPGTQDATDGDQPGDSGPVAPPALPDALSPLGGLTSGVSTLLQGVGAATPLTPLTDAVDKTLTTLTDGLLGKK